MIIITMNKKKKKIKIINNKNTHDHLYRIMFIKIV